MESIGQPLSLFYKNSASPQWLWFVEGKPLLLSCVLHILSTHCLHRALLGAIKPTSSGMYLERRKVQRAKPMERQQTSQNRSASHCEPDSFFHWLTTTWLPFPASQCSRWQRSWKFSNFSDIARLFKNSTFGLAFHSFLHKCILSYSSNDRFLGIKIDDETHNYFWSYDKQPDEEKNGWLFLLSSFYRWGNTFNAL